MHKRSHFTKTLCAALDRENRQPPQYRFESSPSAAHQKFQIETESLCIWPNKKETSWKDGAPSMKLVYLHRYVRQAKAAHETDVWRLELSTAEIVTSPGTPRKVLVWDKCLNLLIDASQTMAETFQRQTHIGAVTSYDYWETSNSGDSIVDRAVVGIIASDLELRVLHDAGFRFRDLRNTTVPAFLDETGLSAGFDEQSSTAGAAGAPI